MTDNPQKKTSPVRPMRPDIINPDPYLDNHLQLQLQLLPLPPPRTDNTHSLPHPLTTTTTTPNLKILRDKLRIRLQRSLIPTRVHRRDKHLANQRDMLQPGIPPEGWGTGARDQRRAWGGFGREDLALAALRYHPVRTQHRPLHRIRGQGSQEREVGAVFEEDWKTEKEETGR
jgi:hypothetical protein